MPEAETSILTVVDVALSMFRENPYASLVTLIAAVMGIWAKRILTKPPKR